MPTLTIYKNYKIVIYRIAILTFKSNAMYELNSMNNN